MTIAEAKITAALAQGKSLQEIASAVGITLGTARSQLKSVFLKTSTSRQAQLVALVLASVAMLGSG